MLPRVYDLVVDVDYLPVGTSIRWQEPDNIIFRDCPLYHVYVLIAGRTDYCPIRGDTYYTFDLAIG
jgi:hypothetical protein